MLEQIKNGLYSDITINFNNVEIKTHLLYLKQFSTYFNGLSVTNFKDQTCLSINLDNLNNQKICAKLFIKILDIIYNNTDINFNNNEYDIIKLVDIYLLWDYFGVCLQKNTETECKQYIKNRIYSEICSEIHFNDFEACTAYKSKLKYSNDSGNFIFTCDNVAKGNIAVCHNDSIILTFSLSNITKYTESKKIYNYVIVGDNEQRSKFPIIDYPTLKKSHGWSKETYEEHKNKGNRIFINQDYIDVECYCGCHHFELNQKMMVKQMSKLSFEYSKFLLDMFTDDDQSIHNRILKNSNFDLSDIPKYDKKFHKLACYYFSQIDI